MKKIKLEKTIQHKKPLMAKKTRATDYEADKKKSLSVTEDYKDFGNLERKSAKGVKPAKRDGVERRQTENP